MKFEAKWPLPSWPMRSIAPWSPSRRNGRIPGIVRFPFFTTRAMTASWQGVRSKRGWAGKILRRQCGKVGSASPKSYDGKSAKDATGARHATQLDEGLAAHRGGVDAVTRRVGVAGHAIAEQIAGLVVAVGFDWQRTARRAQFIAGRVDGVGITVSTERDLGAVAAGVVLNRGLSQIIMNIKYRGLSLFIQLCLAEEKQATVEKLRAMAQHQLTVHSLDLPGDAALEIANTFLYISFLQQFPRINNHCLYVMIVFLK